MVGVSRIRLRGLGSPQRNRRGWWSEEWSFTPGDATDHTRFLVANVTLTNFVALWDSSGRGTVARSTRGQALVELSESNDEPVISRGIANSSINLRSKRESAYRVHGYRFNKKLLLFSSAILALAAAAAASTYPWASSKVALVPSFQKSTVSPTQAAEVDCSNPFEVGISLDEALSTGTFRPTRIELGGVRSRRFDSLCGGVERKFQVVESKSEKGWLIEKVVNLTK